MTATFSSTPTGPVPTLTAWRAVATAWRWERRKGSLGSAAVAGALVGGLGMVIAWWTYRTAADELAAQGLTWQAVLLLGSQLPGLLFLPAVLGVLAAVDAAREQRARGWQRARAMDRTDALLAGMLLRNLDRALVVGGAFLAVLLLAVPLLGFADALPAAVVVAAGRLVAAAACGWAVGSVVTVAGLWIRGLSGLAAVSLVAVMTGLMLRLVAPAVADLYPFTSMMSALTGVTASTTVGLTSPVSMAGWTLVGVAWVGVAYVVGRVRARRMEV